MLLHQIVESGPADPQQLGRFRQIGAGLSKRQLKDLAFRAGSRGADAERLRLFSRRRQADITWRQ